MSYTALYRKFRPDTFEDVKGQGAYRHNTEKSSKSRQNRTCILILRNQGNW